MSDLDPQRQLLRLRSTIDNIDAALVHMLAERFKATQRVGELKAEHDMPPSDPAREARQIARLRELAEQANLDPEFAEKWFNFVVAEVIHHHVRIAAENGDEAANGDGASAWNGDGASNGSASSDGTNNDSANGDAGEHAERREGA